MRFSLMWCHRRRGIVLISFGIIATLWLGIVNKLSLYIHPRYFTFSVVIAALGGLMIIHVMRQKSSKNNTANPKQQYVSLPLIVISFTMLLVLQPASLSSNIASQRGINTTNASEALDKLANFDVVSPFGNTGTGQLSVKDWSNLLAQTSDQTFFAGKQATLTGFVTADDNINTFFVSRFVISCCAVDARPIGVPVYSPGWHSSLEKDEWVEVTGVFGVHEGLISIKPDKITSIPEPESPYVY